MTHGPGKYDELTSYVRKQTEAPAVIVIVFGGNKGSGFSVQMDERIMLDVPKILRELADEIAEDLKSGPGEPRHD